MLLGWEGHCSRGSGGQVSGNPAQVNIGTVYNWCEISYFLTLQEDASCGAVDASEDLPGSPWLTTQMRAAHLKQCIIHIWSFGPSNITFSL